MRIKDMRILIVDDDKRVREIIKDNLILEGAIVSVAKDGEDGFSLMLAEEFDLVLSDIRTPGCSGLKLLEKVKNYEGKTPDIILISAFSSMSSEEVKKMGASALFVKKNMMKSLLEYVENKKKEKESIDGDKDFNILNFTIN